MSANASRCPWCGRGTWGNGLAGVTLVVLVGTAVLFATGLLSFDGVARLVGRGSWNGAEEDGATTTSGGGTGWRLPPGPEVRSGGHAVVLDRAASLLAAIRGPVSSRASTVPCADSGRVSRLVDQHGDWSDGDLLLVACGRVRTGFTEQQLDAALGQPVTVMHTVGPGREERRYDSLRVIIENGRVISVGR